MTEPETTSDEVLKADDKPDDESDDVDEEGEAPTLVETKLEDDSTSKLKQELEDESPKTFPQVVSIFEIGSLFSVHESATSFIVP
jgi:hypothetical protein